jgi:hypothetical protein
MPNNAVLVVAGDFKTEENNGLKNTLVISKGPAIEETCFCRRANNSNYQSNFEEDPNKFR